nr:tape measure protein [Arthrobacter woluwensis]
MVAGLAVKGGISRALNIEDAQAKLTGLGHSTQSVTKIMNNAMAAVKGTAFGMGDAATVAAGVVAAGVKPGQDLERTLKLVGDSATIAGVGMGEMGAIFNKVAASNKIQGDVIAQLNDAGIPIVQLLGKELGKTSDEVYDLASKGKIDFATFQNAMEKGLGGAALKSGETFRGSMANLKAALGRVGETVMLPFLSAAKDGMNGLIPIIDGVNKKLKPVFANVMKGYDALIGGWQNANAQVNATGFVGTFLRIGAGARKAFDEVKGGITAMVAAYQAGGSDVTSTGFAGVLERVGLFARSAVGSVQAFFAAFKAGGDDVTSSGFSGFMERLGLAAASAVAFVRENASAFKAVAAAIGASAIAFKVLTTATSVYTAVTKGAAIAAALFTKVLKTNPFVTILSALVGVGTALAYFFTQTDAGRALWAQISAQFQAFSPVISALATAFQPLGAAFAQLGAQLASQLAPVLAQLVSTLLPAVVQIFQVIGPAVMQVLAALMPLVSALVSALVPVITMLVSTVLPPVISLFTAIVSAITPLINILLAVLIPVIQALMPVVTTVFGAIANVITSVMQIVQGVIQVVTGIISGNWSQVWQGIQNIFKGIWNTIGSIVTGAISIVRTVISSGLSLIGSLWSSAWNGIKSFFTGLWSNITGAISSGINNVVSFFRDLPGKILGALSGLTGSLVQIGRDMIQGLLNGAGSLLSSIGSFFLNQLPGWIVGPFKAALGIHSPSRVFRQFGEFIVQGLAGGVKKAGPQATAAITAVARKVTSEATKHFTKADQLRKAASSLMSRAAQVSGVKAPTLGKDAKANAKKMTAYYAAISKRNKQVASLVAQGRQKLAEANRETSLGRTLDATSRMISASNAQISKLTTQRASIASRLKTAQKSLSDAVKTRDKAASDAAEKFRDEFNLGDLAGRSAQGIVAAAKKTVGSVQGFKGQLDKLRSMGLDSSLLAQIGELGTGKGGSIAKSLIAGGKGLVGQLNGQWKQLGSVSQSAGMSLANGMYGAGIAAQQGLVNGLSGNLKAVDAAIKKVTDRMTSQVKKNLGIHSPSRVFRYEVGRQVPAGLALGVRDGTGLVSRAVDSLVQIPSAVASQPYRPASYVPAPGSHGRWADGRTPVKIDIHETANPRATALETARRLEGL